MLRLCLLVLIILLSVHSKAEVQISVLTTTPGYEMHTMFGHSAVRVVDAEKDFDKVYNYGLFDFKTPFFPFKFLKGDLKYWLGVQAMDKFIRLNNKEKRTINEQVLNLSRVQSERIFNYLNENSKPENKFYRYSFTQKNCSTEIRDILFHFHLIGGRVDKPQTYRQLMQVYMEPHKWLRFGMNMIMGMEVDKEMSYEQQLFIPNNLSETIALSPHLVKENNVLNENQFEPFVFSEVLFFFSSPYFVFSVLFFLSLFCCPIWFRCLVYGLVGLLGVACVLIWLTTFHLELTNNLNVLWCNPLCLVLSILILLKKQSKYLIYTVQSCLILLPLIWLIGFQVFDYQLIPVLFLLTVCNLKQLYPSIELLTMIRTKFNFK